MATRRYRLVIGVCVGEGGGGIYLAVAGGGESKNYLIFDAFKRCCY